MSAPQRSAQRSFSISMAVPHETGEAPMLALIFVLEPRPTPIAIERVRQMNAVGGRSSVPRRLRREPSGVRCGSALGDAPHFWRDGPRRCACSNCVIGQKSAGATQAACDS